MSSFLDQIEPLKQAAVEDLRAARDLASLEQAKITHLGAHGKFTSLLKQLGSLSKEERPAAGKLINQAKVELESVLAELRSALELKAALPAEPIDFTLPGRRRPVGHLHPLTQVTEDIVRIFRKLGFVVADGPEIEDEYHCFDALNTPPDHPARDTQDTFYLAQPSRAGFQPASPGVSPANADSDSVAGKPGGRQDACPTTQRRSERLLLRTHTSSVQIRVMETQAPPIRIIVPGRTYRRANAEATHNPTFQQ